MRFYLTADKGSFVGKRHLYLHTYYNKFVENFTTWIVFIRRYGTFAIINVPGIKRKGHRRFFELGNRFPELGTRFLEKGTTFLSCETELSCKETFCAP